MQPGERIGKYEVESLLGEGGNGVVYAARDTVLGRRVAVKLLHPRFVYDAHIAGRFRAEAEAMARLNHPNVVTVHDFVGDANAWAIVMELVEGGETLASILARDGRLGPGRALGLARQIAAGLGHAHHKGIIHRDIKPANVLVVREGAQETAKVTDFGIARIVDEERRTRGNMTLGTLYYIAPEQAQSSGVDQRADVYSLGITMYEALTGVVPFEYENPAQVLSAHISEAPRPPSARVPGLSPSVDRLVLDCIAKRPEDRPADGQAVLERIDAAKRDLGAGGRDIPRTRMMSEADLTPPPSLEAAPGPARSSFGATSREDERQRDTNLALWIGIGLAVLLSGTCLLGGLLSCLTCAR